MTINFIKIFVDELVCLTKVDGSTIICILQSSKNNFGELENLSSDLLDFHELVITVKVDEDKRLDFPIRIKDIHSIERTT